MAKMTAFSNPCAGAGRGTASDCSCRETANAAFSCANTVVTVLDTTVVVSILFALLVLVSLILGGLVSLIILISLIGLLVLLGFSSLSKTHRTAL